MQKVLYYFRTGVEITDTREICSVHRCMPCIKNLPDDVCML